MSQCGSGSGSGFGLGGTTCYLLPAKGYSTDLNQSGHFNEERFVLDGRLVSCWRHRGVAFFSE